jgi:hypothetical protein
MTSVAGAQSPDDAFATFLVHATQYVDHIYALADQTASRRPGTAAMLQCIAERSAGEVLDIISRWPA